MGSGISQEQAAMLPGQMYNAALLRSSYMLPDIGIDESLLKYSGLDSNRVLQTYSTGLTAVPGYINRLESSLTPMTSVPNSVGLGALVLSMIMEICIKSISKPNDDSYSMLRRVFASEKTSPVRITVLNYLKHHRKFMSNEQNLREELGKLEQQLSVNLATLKSSLMQVNQMSTRGFKIWVNGAAFRIQMLIHEARLNNQTDPPSSHYVDVITNVINQYLQDLDIILPKYKAFRFTKTSLHCKAGYSNPTCCMEDTEEKWKPNHCTDGTDLSEAFVNHVFSHYKPITSLKSYFLNIKNNLNSLINQHEAFNLPPAA